jgi:hypothetical protein
MHAAARIGSIAIVTAFCFTTVLAEAAVTLPRPPTFDPLLQRADTNAPPALGRYQTLDCGAILDHRSGLEWYVGPDITVTWSAAHTWVTQLSVCGGGWQLPNVGELEALFDPRASAGIGYFAHGEHWTAHIDPVFSAIGHGSWVWADETTGHTAPAINFNQGLGVRLAVDPSYPVRAFAVRHPPSNQFQADHQTRPTSAAQPPAGDGLTVRVIPDRTAISVKGEIRNEANSVRGVPKLRVAITDANNHELAMKIVDAPVDHLDAGAMATFETTFEPNDQATGVAVTFVVPKSSPPAPPVTTESNADALTRAHPNPHSHRRPSATMDRNAPVAPTVDCFIFNGERHCD